ncbi:MAG: hypothetical protein ACJ75J_03455 [Cytophagaceae bacterium]
MADQSSIRIRKWDLLLGLTAGTVFVLSVMGSGPGITDDSINYLNAATGFPYMQKIDGSAFTEWPPLYPAILSLYKLSGLNILHFATLVNGISFCLSIVFFNRMTEFLFKNRFVYGTYLLCLLCSVPLIQSSVFLWSESFFILLILLALRILIKYLEKRDFSQFILLIALSILLCLQRKSGIIFCGAFAVILFYYRSQTISKILLEILAYLCLSCAPFFLWTYRRYLLSGSATSQRMWEPERIGENIRQTADILSSWLMPDEIPLPVRSILLAALLLVFILTLRKSEPQILQKRIFLSISIIVLNTYVLTLCLIFLYLRADEPIDDRLLSPVYLFFIFLTFTGIDKLIEINIPARSAGKVILAGAAVLCLYCIVRTGFHICRWNVQGTGGYNTKRWTDNSLIQYLLNDKTGQTIISNNIYALAYPLKFKESRSNSLKNLPDNSSTRPNIVVYFSQGYIHPSVKNDNFTPDTTRGNILYQGKEGIIIQE